MGDAAGEEEALRAAGEVGYPTDAPDDRRAGCRDRLSLLDLRERRGESPGPVTARGLLEGEARRHYLDALGPPAQRSAARGRPALPRVLSKLGTACARAAAAAERQGRGEAARRDREEAEAHLKAALQASFARDDPNHQRVRAAALDGLGYLRLAQGDRAVDSLRHFEAAEDIRARLRERPPRDPGTLGELARSLRNVGFARLVLAERAIERVWGSEEWVRERLGGVVAHAELAKGSLERSRSLLRGLLRLEGASGLELGAVRRELAWAEELLGYAEDLLAWRAGLGQRPDELAPAAWRPAAPLASRPRPLDLQPAL